MKYFLIFLLSAGSIYGAENPYSTITERNAFELTSKESAPVLPPVEKILAPSVFLTGITRWKGTQKVHLVLRKTGETDKFVSLSVNEKQYNVELKKILEDSALVSTNGDDQLLSFETNGLPTIITKTAAAKKTSSSSRYSRDKKEEKKSSPRPPKPQVVTVPSRSQRGNDPRMQQMIEKSLEYVSKIEDPEKRNAILDRIEKYQNDDRHHRDK
jgi:hypothetical protein